MRYPRNVAALPTAVFIDYEDLYHALLSKMGRAAQPERAIHEALEALRTLLQRQMNAQVVALRAYGDFSHPHTVEAMRVLAAAGVEAVYVSDVHQRNATELVLTMDVVAMLAQRPELRRVVVLTGQRLYQPLLRRVKETGRSLVLASTETLRDPAAALLDDHDRTLSLLELAPEALRPDAEAVPAPRRDVEYKTIEDEGALRSLEIIEEFFGQYNEVYLTPLLRKLSDELDDDALDPKTVISDLEEAGAVYLEKRRGYPHDYTVLIVDAQHPDVDRVRQMFEDYDDDDEDESFDESRFDEDEFDDDGFDDSDAEERDASDAYAPSFEDEDMEEAA